MFDGGENVVEFLDYADGTNAYLLQLGFSPVRRRAAGDRRATCSRR